MRRATLATVGTVAFALVVMTSASAGPKLATESQVQAITFDAAPPPTPWTVAYDFDFTTLATTTYSNGSVVIDGKTWTAENSTCLRTFGPLNGTGLRLYPSTTTCDYENTATGTQPNWVVGGGASSFGSELKILASSLLPAGITWPRYQLRLGIQWGSSGIDQNYERFQFGFQRSDDTYGWRVYSISGNETPTYQGFCYAMIQNAATTFIGATLTWPKLITGSDVSSIVIGPNYHYCEGDAWPGSWPSTMTSLNQILWPSAQYAGLSRMTNMTNLQIYMGAYNITALGNAVVDVKRIRLEYR